MDVPTRAAKLAEIWKQLSWLESYVSASVASGGYLAGAELTLADFSWFPTCVFMEALLPRVFNWPQLFDASSPLPNLGAWYGRCAAVPIFAQVRSDILGYWEAMEEKGQFAPIREELGSEAAAGLKWTYP